jgi:hypothetical protein
MSYIKTCEDAKKIIGGGISCCAKCHESERMPIVVHDRISYRVCCDVSCELIRIRGRLNEESL